MDNLLSDIAACRLCSDLPLGPRPTIQASPHATILMIGQAPGTKVHHSGIPWDDASGDRLRSWLNLSKDQLYDANRIAMMPMGFCYPGKLDKGGDKPPRPECAPHWHDRLRAAMPDIQLTLLIGSYAQTYYLKDNRHKTMRETIAHWRDYCAHGLIPLPHPSWRVVPFMKKNPWFETELLPFLRTEMARY